MECNKKAPFWKRYLLAFIILPIYLSSTAHGSTYYVDNSGHNPCANTPTYGTEINPWCTITYGISRLNGGDDLYVKAGTYNEGLYINGPGGSDSKNTVIKAYPGATVIIYGNGVDSGRVKIINTSYMTFDGFIITNFNQGLFVENSNYITVQNCTVHNVGQEAIHILDNSRYIMIQNNTIHDTRKWRYNGEGIYAGTGSTGPLDNTNNVIIKNNLIYNTTDEAIELKPGTHDFLVEGNTIYNCTTDPDWNAAWGNIEVNEATLGVQHWNSNPNHIIRNNIIHDTKTGIRAGTGCIIYNNILYNISSPYYGIYVDNNASDSYTRVIYHNTIDISSLQAVYVSSGTADIKNNIGPTITDNIVSSDLYYVNKTGANYHLLSGSAPINTGTDLTAVVLTDRDGNTRTMLPDRGAYEYVDTNVISPPQNLRIIQ